MATFHQIEVTGNVGRDPEMVYTPEGTARTTFSLAAQTGRGEYKGTIWFRCTFWGSQGEAVNANVKSGDLVHVAGELEHDDGGNPHIWKGKDDSLPHTNFSIRGRVCQFLNLKSGGGGQAEDWGDDWNKKGAPAASSKPADVPF
jgi:single-strand DNA-binding protein